MQQATKSFAGVSLRAPVAAKVARPTRSARLVCKAEFIGSTTNQVMVLATMLPIAAGRFGLAPTARRRTTSSCKLYEDKTVLLGTNDPAGLTATDVLALGALGHAIGVGIVLGLKATGSI